MLHLLQKILILAKHRFHRQVVCVHKTMKFRHQLQNEKAILLQRRAHRCLLRQERVDLSVQLFRSIQLDRLKDGIQPVLTVLGRRRFHIFLLRFRCNLHDIDGLSSPIDDTIGRGLPRAFIRLREIQHMVHHLTDPGGNRRI